jgi:hypothetical protein
MAGPAGCSGRGPNGWTPAQGRRGVAASAGTSRLTGVLQLDDLGSSGGCSGLCGSAAPRGRKVQQPPLLLHLLPLPFLPGPGEHRVHRWGIVSGDEVFEGPRDRLTERRILGPCGLRGGEVRRSCSHCVLLPRLPLAAVRRWR